MRGGWKIAGAALVSFWLGTGCSLETAPLGATDGAVGIDAPTPDAGNTDAGECTGPSDCRGSDICCGGECAAAGCDDGNPCTDDTCGASGCEHVPNADTCDDGVFCNGADTCADGSCSSHAGDPCPGASMCVEEASTCTGCEDDGDCPDDIPGGWSGCGGFSGTCDESGTQTRDITSYSCVRGTCETSTTTDSRSCMRDTDDVPCGDPTAGGWSMCENGSEPCSTMGMQQRPVIQPVCASGSCSGSTSSTESRSCTRDPEGDPCDDGDACTTGDQCNGGACEGGTTMTCDDGNPCTMDACNPGTGTCAFSPTSGSCDDGDGCNGDVCMGGSCVSACDDGDACTDDRCTGMTCRNDTISGCTP